MRRWSETELADLQAVAREVLARASTGLPPIPGLEVGARSLEGPIPRLPEVEEGVVANAAQKRRREFAGGRVLARSLLAELGVPVEAIRRGADRAPQWPADAWGSITHTDDVVVAAVGRADGSTFGIDLEGKAPLGRELWSHVLVPAELEAVGGDGKLAKVVFCAKEAFYKAQFVHTGALLDFLHVRLSLDVGTRTFVVREIDHSAAPHLPRPIQGAWAEVGPYVFAAARVSASSEAGTPSR